MYGFFSRSVTLHNQNFIESPPMLEFQVLGLTSLGESTWKKFLSVRQRQ